MGKKILIVDDRPEVAKVLTIYLKGEYEVVYLDNPAKAIAWLQEANFPDLIISDLNMPEIDGYQFLNYLKSSELFKAIPVMVLSSVESSDERIRVLEDGAADYMLKPFNPQELKVRLKKILR